MRYLGIDFGLKRIGLALSDEVGDFSYPYSVVKNTPLAIKEISAICRKEEVEAIVIGESLNYKGLANPVKDQADNFIEKLKKEINLPVNLQNETLTSAEAERIIGKDEMLDARAASLILKSYLEKIKRNQ